MTLSRTLRTTIANLYSYLNVQTQRSKNRITLFGVVMMINFPLFGVLWKFDVFQVPEEFYLRVLATLFSALLVFSRLWPRQLLPGFPVFWYFTLTFNLPFFFTYVTLLNHGSSSWLMNCVSALFFLLLMVNVLDALFVLVLGFGAGIVLYFFILQHTYSYIPGAVSLFGLVITYMAALIIGSLFARDREITFSGEMSGLRNLAGTLAKNLNTPLESIHQQTEVQELILNKIGNLEAQNDLRISLDKITRSVENSKKLIQLQLNAVETEKLDTSLFDIFQMDELVHDTIDEYPVSASEKCLVTINCESNYPVWVDGVAFKNMLWNLLKQYYETYRIKGLTELVIWLTIGEEKDDFNYLHIKTTLTRRISSEKRTHALSSMKNKPDELAYIFLFLVSAKGQFNLIEKSDRGAYVLVKFPKVE